MEMKDMRPESHPEGCRCMMCQSGKCEMCGMKHGGCCGYGFGWGHCHRHWWVRVVVAVIIAFAIFWIGLRIGSFFGFGGYGPGYGMMRWGNDWGYGYGHAYPMMGGYGWNNSTSSSPSAQ